MCDSTPVFYLQPPPSAQRLFWGFASVLSLYRSDGVVFWFSLFVRASLSGYLLLHPLQGKKKSSEPIESLCASHWPCHQVQSWVPIVPSRRDRHLHDSFIFWSLPPSCANNSVFFQSKVCLRLLTQCSSFALCQGRVKSARRLLPLCPSWKIPVYVWQNSVS